jgi:hypothetical protein
MCLRTESSWTLVTDRANDVRNLVLLDITLFDVHSDNCLFLWIQIIPST